jgi:hypothetical protein
LVYKIAVLNPVEAMENKNFYTYSEGLYGQMSGIALFKNNQEFIHPAARGW